MAKKMTRSAKAGRIVAAKVPLRGRSAVVKSATSKVKTKAALTNRELTRS